MRRHLFSTWYDALITLVFGGMAIWAVVALFRFLLAADFTILRVNLTLFVLGAFPRDQLWRPSA
ncbi:MAG TPA: amino acid ABC transporter permease, partial [Acidimicrobiia bacterium]|nr:amino acid ABC transporter permease [Acidimicrobiia bacterium]